ncbi:MAG: MFS transporter [Anaerolineales bacterium]|nr:MFS transporter [Anaerolineales bacterium]
MTTINSEKLSRKTKLLYGAGDFGFSLTDTVIGVLYAIFLTDVIGIPARYAAGVFLVGRIWDFINDPLMGYISDRTRTRWGRRRPFLLFGFIPFAIAYSLLWINYTDWSFFASVQNSIAGMTKGGSADAFGITGLIFFAAAYIVYETLATLVYMPYFALTPELTLDYDERTDLTSYRMFFSIFAGLIGFVVPFMLIDSTTPENAPTVLVIGIVFGVASALPLLLTFFGTKEREEFVHLQQQSLISSLKAAFRNKIFVFTMFIFLFTWAALNLVQSMLLYFVKYRLGMEANFDLIAGTVFVTAMLTLPIWERLSRKFDKRRAYIFGMVFLSTVLVVLAFINPESSLWIIILFAFLAGIGVAAVHVLPWSMIPDAVEVDELETGSRHEGMYYSLVTLLRKIATAIALPSMLWILDGSGFVSNAAVQTPSATKAIIGLTGPGPAMFMLAGILFAAFYPLSRTDHADIRAKLAAAKAD